jgi:YHS domain-containing protein
MTKRIGRLVSFCGAILLGSAGFLFAHDPEKKSSMDSMCEGHHAEAMKASDQVKAHLAEAKRSGTMADMRNHVESAEKAMAEMGKHMSLCMGMMEKMHGEMLSGEKKMTGKVMDPVCGMEVDAGTALSSTYKGKTYHFCSPEDKAKFEKNPEQYLKYVKKD